MLVESRIRTVVLTVQYGAKASYYKDWLDAFEASSLFQVNTFNLFARAQRRAAMRALADAELTVALHPCSADTLEFIAPLTEPLKARRGRFLMLVGNEYNLPWARLADKRRFIAEVSTDWVGTQLLREAGEWLYEGTGAAVIALPHAVNERVFRRERAEEARLIDIGGRSFQYPVYVGDDERNRVYALFAELGPAAGLKVDLATDARLGRLQWAAFLNACRSTVGTEAGTWYLERDDTTVLAIRDYLQARSRVPAIRADGRLHAAARHLPYSVKTGLKALLGSLPIRHEAIEDGNVAFAEIETRFFAGRSRCPVYSKCISSRHFEAAATGTCQLLTRGRYNDILVADRDYIAFDPDLDNASEAVRRLRDRGERLRVSEAAHALVHQAHTYAHRLSALYRAISAG